MTVEAGRGLIGSLLHGLEILDMFERDRPEIGIGEMAQQLGLHRSTTSRLAATLAVAGYLEPAGEPGRYRLSGRLAALGELAAAAGDVRRTALPYLQELVRELGETGHLGVLEGTDAVTIEVVDGWQTVRMHSWVGKRSPAHCSSMGKALLAGLSDADFAARYPGHPLEPRTDRTITDTGVLAGAAGRGAGAWLRGGPGGAGAAPVLRGRAGVRPDRDGGGQHQRVRSRLPDRRGQHPRHRGRGTPGRRADQRASRCPP